MGTSIHWTLRLHRCGAALFLLATLWVAVPGHAYSVLTHEAIVDLAWDDSIRPFLLSRYPNATEEELRVAHAFAYGGCAIQDMGYYPFGKTFFSDLTHYVRSGDFVASLFRNAHSLNELGFAAGALTHYTGDSFGHGIAVNHATALAFPKLGQRYGPVVTYEDNPHAHVRVEFGFDIEQVSKHRFSPHAYLAHIGLRVPRRLLEKAFFETYGLPLHEILGGERPSIRSYRTAVRRFIPFFGRGEVVLHRNEYIPERDTPAFETFAKEVENAEYRRKWGKAYHGPGFLGHVSAVIIWLVPKWGPAAMLAIKIPDHEMQELYLRSVNETLTHVHAHLTALIVGNMADFELADRDLDTGAKVRPGGYRRTDQTYAKLLHTVVNSPRMAIPEGLKEDVLAYYADPDAPITTKKNAKAWTQVQQELNRLQQMRALAKPETPREAE